MMASVDKITKENDAVACRCTFVFSRFFDMEQFENLQMGVSTERTIGIGSKYKLVTLPHCDQVPVQHICFWILVKVTDLKLEFDENKEIISTDVKTAELVNSDEIDLMDDDLENETSDDEDDRGVAEGEISDDDDMMNNRIQV